MKYFIIAGEASGDLHGANLMEGLKNVDPEADFMFFGGDLMKDKGGTLIKHYREMAFLGYFDVIRNIRTIAKNFEACKKSIYSYRPDVVILIDYPSFNLKIAKFAKSLNIKVFYYISPKIWVWKEYRIKAIKRYIDKMFVIFPFEMDYYKKFDYPVDYEGNPLLDPIDKKKKNKLSFTEFTTKNGLNDKPIIAILPGSREAEIKWMLPVMLEVVADYRHYQLVIAGTSALDVNLYKIIMGNNHDVKLLIDQTYDILIHSQAALVTSGTATLETALFKVPQVVCYRGGVISYLLIKPFLKVKYVSLVNLIMEKEVVKELIQFDFTPEKVGLELNAILNNTEYRESMLKNYEILSNKIGKPGSSFRIAEKIYQYLENI